MSYFLFFLPVLPVMFYGLYGTYRRGDLTQFWTLVLISLMIIVRFATMAIHFGGLPVSPVIHFLETLAGLYIIPTMYMYLCGQCGTRWNNREAIIQVLLPVLVLLIGTRAIDFGETPTTTHHDLVSGALNIYNNGTRVMTIVVRHVVVIIQSLIVAYCMLRLWSRVRRYGLKFTKYMKMYYVWMFFMLGGMIVNHLLALDASLATRVHFLHFAFFGIIITIGYIIIPGTFKVAPIVDAVSNHPVVVDEVLEESGRLADHLHQLMEDDRIYLRPGIHVDEVADIMGTTCAYVTRLMRTEFGQSFTDYVNCARVIYSKKLLLTSSKSIEDVALASGFSDALSYTSVFEHYTDSTPERWKRENDV